MKSIFTQMETEVASCSVDKKYFEIEKKELSLDNDHLLEHIIYQDVMNTIMHANDHSDNVLPAKNNSLEHDNSTLELLKHENDRLMELLISQNLTELDKKNDMIEKAVYNELSKRCSRLENRYLQPLPPLVKHNRDAHVNYLKHTKENADTLCEIIKQARELRPLDSDLNSACKFVTRIQELLVYVNDTCPSSKPVRVTSSSKASGLKPRSNTQKDRITQTSSSNKKKNKVEDQPRIGKSSLNNVNRVSKIVSTENVKHSVLSVNFEFICATCHECMFDAIHDLCVSDYLNDVNARDKSKSVKSRSAKSKKKKMWKPTGKVYTNVGYSWKTTGRIFTIDGNTCPLTRIISTKVVSPRKSNSTTIVKQTQQSSNKSGKLKEITNVGSSSKSKTIGRTNRTLLGNVTISWVYYVEGLGHNLFSVGQFFYSDLEVAFRKHTCYVRNLNGADLLSGSRDTNLYTIYLDDMLKSSLICLLSKASKTKSWSTKAEIQERSLCLACSLGKSKKSSHKPKDDDTNQEKLYLLHMDLCGPMCVESINGKKYILVIVDDYSRFTWVKFLISKDEAPEVIIKCLKQIQVHMNATVHNIRTDNRTEFVNQTLKDYYENVRISHQTSVTRTPQQNGIVKRQNRTLVEAARTMLIFSKALLYLWEEVVSTACYTQNCSLICLRYNKTPYKLMHEKKPDLSFLHVFGSLCYPTNDSKDLGKLKPKADICIFVGYALAKKAFRIYNKRTRLILETIHVKFDELSAMASEQFSSGLAFHDILFQPMFDEFSNPPPSVVSPVPAAVTRRPADLTGSPVSTSLELDAPSARTLSTQEQEHSLIISQGVEESLKTPHFHDDQLLETLYEDSTIMHLLYPVWSHQSSPDMRTRSRKLLPNQSTTSQALHNYKIYTIGFTHNPNHTITQDNYNRDLILRRREERSLNNNSFLGEYECSSLALDRDERRDEKKRLDHLKQDQTMLVIKRFSERKKVFRERKKTGKIRAKRRDDFGVEVDVRVLEEEVVPKVDDVSLVDRVFDGAFGGEEEKDVVMVESVVVTSSSLEMLTNSCLGGIMVSLIFLEGLEEEA
ncbi:retrovirus-related pol polyprotein from transposon TNT 1-94 [Tanacetum coccineum]|uniref:Retrovirus-related pol polyprotein from transposon TNT 1-94 n=1 Tax=Tanacetum coccineum TaxID=301880 RepID=A0ABQ5B7N6_9ASTR